MKTLRLLIFGSVSLGFMATSCQREALEESGTTQPDKTEVLAEQAAVMGKAGPQTTCNPNAYVITLESRTQVSGFWEWVWSVRNPNPGNGNNGTAQDLSHWGMKFGSCVTPTSFVSAAYSANGTSWSSFTPSFQADPSQGCMTTPVLKFDFGTSGSTKSWYRLVVNQDYQPGVVQGYYKSGNNTGCCTFNFTGIGECGGPIEIEIIE